MLQFHKLKETHFEFNKCILSPRILQAAFCHCNIYRENFAIWTIYFVEIKYIIYKYTIYNFKNSITIYTTNIEIYMFIFYAHILTSTAFIQWHFVYSKPQHDSFPNHFVLLLFLSLTIFLKSSKFSNYITLRTLLAVGITERKPFN